MNNNELRAFEKARSAEVWGKVETIKGILDDIQGASEDHDFVAAELSICYLNKNCLELGEILETGIEIKQQAEQDIKEREAEELVKTIRHHKPVIHAHTTPGCDPDPLFLKVFKGGTAGYLKEQFKSFPKNLVEKGNSGSLSPTEYRELHPKLADSSLAYLYANAACQFPPYPIVDFLGEILADRLVNIRSGPFPMQELIGHGLTDVACVYEGCIYKMPLRNSFTALRKMMMNTWRTPFLRHTKHRYFPGFVTKEGRFIHIEEGFNMLEGKNV